MAPLEKGNGPVPSERSPEVDDHRGREREDSNSSGSGSSSSGSSSSSTSSSSSNSSSSSSSSSSSRSSSSKSSSSSSGGNSSISDTVSRDDRVADPTVGRDKASYQKGHTEEEGRSGDTNTAGTQQSQVYATNARSEARDATESSARLEGGDSGSTLSPLPTTSVGSNEIRHGLSGASVASVEAGVGRERRGSRAAMFNAADARVKAGQLSRAGSTRATTAGSRVEVRGELEVTNVSSAQELIQLLEDSSSPFALQLQNVELRVGPSQSVRLGEAVPALREHLRRDLQRQLRQAAGPDGDTQSRVPTGGRHSASRGGASVSSPRHSSNILLTGTVIGGAHPRLLSSRERPGATAKTSAMSHPQALIGREAAPARSIPSGEHSAVSVVAASGVAATQRTDDGEATSAAAVSVPVSAAVAEQAQQQRASAEATSLVQQILEVQGQVKSLLAEEGLSPVAAEAGALKKKKGAQEDAEDERRPGRRISGNSGPPAGSLNDSTHGGRAAGEGAGSSSSAFSILGSSGSSGSRTSVRGSLMPKAAPVLQQNSGAAAVVKEITDGDAALEYPRSSGTERREKLESAAEEASPIEGTKVKTVARTRKSTVNEGEGRKEESDSVQQEKEKEEEEQSGRGVAVSAGRRNQGSLQTNVDQARIEVTAETLSPVDVKDTHAKDSEEAEAAEGTAAVTQRGPIGGAARERGGARVTEKKDHTVSIEKANETKQRIRGRTREAEVRGTGGGARGDNETPEPRAPAAKEKEGGVKEGSWEETKEDRRSSTGPDESAGMTTDQASARSERIGSAHEAVDEQKRVCPGETLGELPEVNVPAVVPKKGSEGLAISEEERGQVKEEAEKPSGGKPFLTKPGTDGTSPRAARGLSSSTERREQERRVGGSSEKSITHESEVQEQASAAAAASPAPTFVQALSSFFSWGAADEETKPSPAPKNEVEANEKKVSAEGEADKETTKGPAVRPEQVGAPAPTTAEKGGKGVEGQDRKEPRRKLKPKAPPAGIALSKRDKA